MNEIDGVPVFSAPGDGHTAVALFFGIGLCDETYDTCGLTHLIEHLVMGSLPRTHLERNAFVDVDTTVFHAEGSPGAVKDFLERVCAALSDLPLARLEQERGVVATEQDCGFDPTTEALWAFRYGLDGPGTAILDVTKRDQTAASLLAHAARWFTRGNAALAVRGDVPEGLRLQLPEGEPPARRRLRRREQDGPVWSAVAAPGVGLALSGPATDDPAFRIGAAVLQHRLTEVARHERGLSYSVLPQSLYENGREDITITLDAREGQESQVAGIVWQELVALAERGPTSEDLEFVVQGVEEASQSPELPVEDLHRRCWMHVRRMPFRPLDVVAASWRATTPAAVQAAVRDALRTAAVTVPCGEQLPADAVAGTDIREVLWCDGAADMPAGRSYRPPRLARWVTKRARYEIVVGDDAIAIRDEDGDVHTVRWQDVVDVVTDPEDPNLHHVLGINLCTVSVDTDVIGKEALTDLQQRLERHRASAAQTVTSPL